MAENRLSQEEHDLVNQLRSEASDLKECFTRYSFQALAIAAAGFGLIARYQREFPASAIGASLLAILLLAVARIGTYKYGSANRSYGYELHLHRTSRLRTSSSPRWTPAMRSIGWEEAMRAWRVVQATTFEELYTFGRWTPNRLRSQYRRLESRWWEPDSLLVNDAAWHSGTYLKTMLDILHFVAAGCLIPLGVLCKQMQVAFGLPSIQFAGALALTLITGSLIFVRVRHGDARCALLERGLLCIHSCAIMWHAVVVAHYRTLLLTGGGRDGMLGSYEGYTGNLSGLAVDLAKNIENIHRWIEQAEDLDGPEDRFQKSDMGG